MGLCVGFVFMLYAVKHWVCAGAIFAVYFIFLDGLSVPCLRIGQWSLLVVDAIFGDGFVQQITER